MDSTDDQYPKAPASIRQGGPDAAAPGSQEIINANSGDIAAFVHAQRQNVARSIIDYHSAKMTGPGVDVHYQNNQGAEIITVHPHPPPQPPSPIEQAVQELAAEGVPIPESPLSLDHPSKYLMVLFKKDGKTDDSTGKRLGDGIAAFKMSDLTATGCGSAEFLGRSQESRWVDTIGKILQVGQYQFGTKGCILCPIDFTVPDQNGDKFSARNLWLSTTALTDGVATDADIQSLPILNSNGEDLFTVGGKYRPDQSTGALVLQQHMAIDGGVPVAPIAIDPDGTSYFFPTVQGQYITVLLDPKSKRAYSNSDAFHSALTVEEEKLYDKLPNVSPYCVTYYYETSDITVSGGTISELMQRHEFVDIYAVQNGYLLGFIDGESYFGSASFGQIPAPKNVKLEQSPKDVEVYDITVNHTAIRQTPFLVHGSVNFDNTFPLPIYYGGGVVSAFGFQITGSGSTTNHPQVENTDKTLFHSLLQSPFYSALQPLNLSDPLSSTATVAAVHVNKIQGVTYPFTPGTINTDFNSVKDVHDQALILNAASPNVIATASFTCTVWTYTQSGPLGGGGTTTYSETGDFYTSDTDPNPSTDLPFPAGSIFLSGDPFINPLSATHLVPVDPAHAQAWIDQHVPYSVGSSGTVFRADNTVVAFGHTLTYHYDVLFGPHQLPPPTITAHAHPPALALKDGVPSPFFTETIPSTDPITGTDTTTRTVYTPYGPFPCGRGTSFTPWLHISNNKHCVQAFYVDDQPYAFVDGSDKTGFLDAIAKACGCKTTEIVAMFMDIELRTIKNVAKVQLPDYSTSANNPPPVPGH